MSEQWSKDAYENGPGLCLIIEYDFEGDSRYFRAGSNQDTEMITKVWKAFGFTVRGISKIYDSLF